MKLDDRIDAYIAKSELFAQPILKHIRKLIHHSCPEVEETIKWGFPHFVYCGEILCSMASFKKHCAFGFWKGALISELGEKINDKEQSAMGQFGRIESKKDLPKDTLFKTCINKAMRLNVEGIKLTSRRKSEKEKTLIIPAYFKDELKKSKRAFHTFESFSYSNKKDYVEWVKEAKTEATREKRMNTTIEWLKEGKDKNWKYKKY